jgi:hypothetical protein
MLTLRHNDMEIVYRTVIRSGGLWSAERVSRHAARMDALDARGYFRRVLLVYTDAGCPRFVWQGNMEFAVVKYDRRQSALKIRQLLAHSRLGDVRCELSLI